MLLLAGYFILFASQFNGRYYSVANFYVYNATAANGNVEVPLNNVKPAPAALTNQAAHQGITQKGARFSVNQKRPSHLGIDKRFRLRAGIRVPQIRAPGLPCYTLARPRFYSSLPVYSTSDLPTNALRGPPCA
jgi:hypothetical protein